MEAAVPTGTPAPESVVSSAPAAAAAQPTPAAPAAAEANPWEQHIDEYTPDPSLATSAVEPAKAPDPNAPAPETVPPAGALKTDTTVTPGTEGQPPASAAPGPIPYERFQEVNQKATKALEMAEFYQQQYNNLVAQQQTPAPAAAPTTTDGKPVAQPDQLPAGIKGPGEWVTQEEMAAYHDHVATVKAQTMVKELAQVSQQYAVQMQAMNKWVGTLEDMVVRAAHPDFEAVTQPVLAELFVTDHEGKIWTDPQGQPKIKNPALMNWIRQSPSPRKALYDYALSKQAPQKISEAVQTTTKQLLTALDTRPKGPTQPRQAGGDTQPASLDWDTPRDVADQVLSQAGVI